MHQPTGPLSILWFRRDLRLTDNRALARALADGGRVLCVYIREPGDRHAGANGAAQAWWLHRSLSALDAALRARGNALTLLTGDPRHLLEWLVDRTGARAVFWNRRYDGPGREIDTEIKARLREKGVRAESASGFLLHDPTVLKTQQGRPFSVYTPFWKAFERDYTPPEAIAAPEHIPAPDLPSGTAPEGEPIESWALLPTRPDWAAGFGGYWQPGEDGAQKLLAAFLDRGLAAYGSRRDFPADTHTSRLSPHLAFGEISPHAVWITAGATGRRIESDDLLRFRKELVWRDFAWHILFHHPHLDETNLDRRFDGFAWKGSNEQFAAWCRGRTGYPIVDAGMRELWATGTMHNRIRMVAASFLIKDLLIDWRRGERFFRDTLVDADTASNPFNWQWVAGCGADAAPFFRIFNPILQGQKFDPEGHYVRRWCPELAHLPDEFVHRPFDAPAPVLATAGVVLGRTYPRPLVDHHAAKEAAMAALNATRQEVERA
jgi:deoxyribodipyrimidine photo-lyase